MPYFSRLASITIATVATTDLPSDSLLSSPFERSAQPASESFSLAQLLAPLASLKLTVGLFAISIVLVLAGTLAQIDHDIWYVIDNYFRCFLTRIEFQVFFPRSWDVPGTFPFPGGWLIGTVLGVNLLAAHALRFKVVGTGRSLWLGWALIAAGATLIYMVIQTGTGETIKSELSPAFRNGLWHALRSALGGGTLLLGYVLALSYSSQRKSHGFWLWVLGAITCAILAVLTGWLFANPDARLAPASLRILWQLIKGGGVGLVLLAGCYLVFGRRGGVVLLHGGIALLMFSELFTGIKAIESDMVLQEGETRTFAEDSRSAELVFVDKSDSLADKEIVIPLSRVQDAHFSAAVIDDPSIPLKLRIVEYLPNAMRRLRMPDEETPATRGEGLLYSLEEKAITTGVDREQTSELPGIYVELIDRESDQSLGTVMLWSVRYPLYQVESLRIDDKLYELSFRQKRIHKGYSVQLIDFRHDKYVGSNQAKNFSSDIRLLDPENNVDRQLRTWMNNPVRYDGDTIYQSGYDTSTRRETTILQVVTNSGWLIPYVSCMLIAIGMFAHFWTTLYKFAQRKTITSSSVKAPSFKEMLSDWRSPAVWVPTLVLALCGGYVLSKFRPPSAPADEMQLHEFAKLPVAYQGRIQPLDTLARNALTVVCEKETVVLPGKDGEEETVPAIRWLLDLLTDSPDKAKYRCLRIDNLDVLQTLDLERRSRFRYSIEELMKSEQAYIKQVNLAAGLPEQKRSLVQARFLQLADRVALIRIIQDSFSSPIQYLKDSTFQQMRTGLTGDSAAAMRQDLASVTRKLGELNKRAPRVIPPATGGELWKTLLESETSMLDELSRDLSSDAELDPAAAALRGILASYAEGNAEEFNEGIKEYRKILADRAEVDAEYHDKFQAASGPGTRKTAEKLSLDRVDFEAYFNSVGLFKVVMALYILAFLLASAAWLGGTTIFNRSANWLLWFAFVLHTLAIVGRIYISGRPPVTNLYSSAVFIGWGAVLYSLVYEYVYRIGIGNLLAAAVGFPTLFIAYNLAGDGDTFEVLQAVLDTQFWLATHVVCITLGYSTTLLAGAIGVGYILLGLVAGKLDDKQRQQLTRMTYGTICFATLFSLVGTILGGLWADFSWGRFWGWDPKENGALIIVIWNALVLHARWGGMIQKRGLAVLAVFGNVVTAWSWFGTNAMGVGLHSYGFRAGMAFWLTVFISSQLAIMLLGMIMPDKRDDEPVTVADGSPA